MAMIKLRCVVEHITYQNQENGYSVMRVKVKDYADLVTLVGNLLDVPVGPCCYAMACGRWTNGTGASSSARCGKKSCLLRYMVSRSIWEADW